MIVGIDASREKAQTGLSLSASIPGQGLYVPVGTGESRSLALLPKPWRGRWIKLLIFIKAHDLQVDLPETWGFLVSG
jgi:hypothetical protein